MLYFKKNSFFSLTIMAVGVVVVLLSFVFFGCAVNSVFDISGLAKNNTTTTIMQDRYEVSISVSAPNSRSMTINSYFAKATKSGESDVTQTTASSSLTLTLKLGVWHIEVWGRDEGGRNIYYGYNDVTVVEGGANIDIGVVSVTGASKCSFSYALKGYVSKITISASRSSFATIMDTIDISTNENSGSVYLFGLIEGDWTFSVEGRDAANGLYYSKSFTKTIINNSVNEFSTVLDQEKVTDIEFSPLGGTYNSDQNISLSCQTPGVTIRYTLDGSNPTASSSVYSGAIGVVGNGANKTIKARGFKSGLTDGNITSESYSIQYSDLPSVVMNPAGGSYNTDKTVTLSCSESGTTIYYSTDGSAPSLVYSGAITVMEGTTTIKAKAVKNGFNDSGITSELYSIDYPDCASPTMSPSGGTYSSAQNVTISCSTSGATIYYTTDGSTPTTSSSVYSGAIALSGNGSYTIKALAAKSGYDNSSVTSDSYTINVAQTTAIRVHIDVGSGNSVYIRGDSSPLSWSSGVEATWTSGNVWEWTTTELSNSFEFKAVLNDSVYESGSNHSGTVGQTIDIYLTRFRINYNTGGGTMYLQGDSSPLSWTEASGLAGTWTTGDWWEVLVSDLPSSFEFKWRKDGTWGGGGNHSGSSSMTNEVSWQN